MPKRTTESAPNEPPADEPVNVPKPEPAAEKKPKKPRTESPEAIAFRARRIGRQLKERLAKEHARHTAKVLEIESAINAHEDECKQLPDEARRMLEKLSDG